MNIIKTGNIYDKENSMNLLNLSENEINQLIESLATNPSIEEDKKEPTLHWLREQLSEQKIGGAWKRRLREKGHVI
jgi:signal recognition particle subunit SEC65|tara:strand:+ start:88 stop:315 length:228 start_codon:yes stop_codon:yes gene_type:complete